LPFPADLYSTTEGWCWISGVVIVVCRFFGVATLVICETNINLRGAELHWAILVAVDEIALINLPFNGQALTKARWT
jgi:hypothetical protein